MLSNNEEYTEHVMEDTLENDLGTHEFLRDISHVISTDEYGQNSDHSSIEPFPASSSEYDPLNSSESSSDTESTSKSISSTPKHARKNSNIPELTPPQKISSKRQRRLSQWKQNKAKALRNQGLKNY
ncbi:uncharacterized protein [Musca autumnalis]|uniref:uncharacterized protein n=1 Tax=Musca autumnalis TaxID=221902 RepID=UPI003CF36C28